MRLPQNIDPIEFDSRYRFELDQWSDAVQEICNQHGISLKRQDTFRDGSNLLCGDNDHIIKIFPPFHQHQWESEWRVLKHLWSHSQELPIPRLFAHGERANSWTYVIMSRLSGVTLESVWPQCSQDEKARLLTQIGKLMAKVHSIPVGELQNLDPRWNQFLGEQRQNFLARHARMQMPDWFLRDASAFVDETFAQLALSRNVILTGEYTPFNLLVEGKPGQRRLSGMIDFGDAMIGHNEYDFLGPMMFMCEGRSESVSALLAGYGFVSERNNLSTRLMALAILHRYSNFKFQIRIPNWEQTGSLKALEKLLFPL